MRSSVGVSPDVPADQQLCSDNVVLALVTTLQAFDEMMRADLH